MKILGEGLAQRGEGWFTQHSGQVLVPNDSLAFELRAYSLMQNQFNIVFKGSGRAEIDGLMDLFISEQI